jgi:hypothetical protein
MLTICETNMVTHILSTLGKKHDVMLVFTKNNPDK